MIDLSGIDAPVLLSRTTIAEDEESECDDVRRHRTDKQASDAVERRDDSQEMSVVRYQDILPVVQTLGTRVIVCQYLTLGLTAIVCFYMTFMIFDQPHWLSARLGYHESPSLTLPEPSQHKSPQTADAPKQDAIREGSAATLTASPAEMSSTLSRRNNAQRPTRSTDAPEQHDRIKKPRSRRTPQRRVKGGPTASAPSSSYRDATMHKDSQGFVDYWLVRRGDGASSRMMPVGVTSLGVVFRDMDDGQTYLLTEQGEWTKYRPN
jgi:hypothetical protein